MGMVVKCMYPGEAMKWLGCEIMHFLVDKNDSKKRYAKHARAIAFSPKASKWKVQFDDGVCMEINYGQLCCRAKRHTELASTKKKEKKGKT